MKKIYTLLSVAALSLNMFAQFGYNANFQESDFKNAKTVVKKEGTIEWDNGSVRCGGSSIGIDLNGPAWNWDDKYFDIKLAAGVPNKLSFQYAGNNVTSTGVLYYVKESADGTTWTDLWSISDNTTSFLSVSKDLKTTTKYLRFCFSGNFAGYFKNIKVTEQILMGAPSVTSLDFGTVKVDDAVDAKEFTINYTGLTATATSSDAHFTVSPAAFGDLYDYKVTQTIAVALLTTEAGNFTSTVTVEGRGKSAQVEISGKVEKYDQTITWEPETQYNYGETIPTAVASSLLDVEYEISDPTVLKFESGAFKTLHGGTTTVTAKQTGNYKYNAATPVVKTITIVPPTTYGNFNETSCDTPVTFNGVEYSETTNTDVNVGQNHLGGDSIVHVSITINKSTSSEENKTIVYGDTELWNGIALNDSAVGTHKVIFVTTNVVGCDSTVTLNLTVNKMDVYTTQKDLEFCDNDSAEYRGVWYKTAGSSDVTATGEIRDTTITVVVTVYATDYIEDSKTVTVGETFTWNENDYTIEQAGDTTLVDSLTNINGCDSVIVLNVHADVPAAFYNTTYIETQSAKKVIRNGEIYILRGKDLYDLTGRKQD